ncbi:MAG: protein phosphatase CheZ [Deltaproteobacteria bacterium]|nr:protein phosphatase CheZ [Deltaproteobacteria bacterium]
MNSMIMGVLDGGLERIAFDTEDIRRIITRYKANLVFRNDLPGLFLEFEGRIYSVGQPLDREEIKPYFILLESGTAFNISSYEVLFGLKDLPEHFISGTDASGQEYLCRKLFFEDAAPDHLHGIGDENPGGGIVTQGDLKDLKDMITNLRNGHFFEALTTEFSGRIKEIAKELIDFRRDIQKKIEPDIVEIAARDIPEASSQLEGINETLEASTMKIMDINEEQMEIAGNQLANLESFVSGNGKGRVQPGVRKKDTDPVRKAKKKESGSGESAGETWVEGTAQILEQQMEVLKRIRDLSLGMMEPLSFQDLVGQRIQRIIKLVKSMEVRIEDMIISFGIKIQKHKENPNISFEDLSREVEQFKSELKGPQRDGEGLAQEDIDELLATL